MKIGIDGLSVTPEEGGFYRAFKQLLECCSFFPPENEVVVFLSHETYESFSIKSNKITFKIVNYPKKLRYWAAQAYFPIAAYKYKLDILYSPVSASPFISKTKKICMVNDLSFIKSPNELTLGAKLYWNYLFPFTLRRCHKIACLSEATRNDVVNLLGYDRNSLYVIYPYVDINLRNYNNLEDNMILRKFNIKKPYLLYVGVLAPRKNIVGLVSAFSLTLKSSSKLSLVLCGKLGWDANSIKSKIKGLEISDNVILTGFVSDRKLSALYRNASLLILPSFCEGFGYPLIEAMSFGVPVIGSNNSSIPEIINDERFLFDPFDINDIAECIKRALDIKAKEPLLGEALKEKAARFSKSNTYAQLYQMILR